MKRLRDLNLESATVGQANLAVQPVWSAPGSNRYISRHPCWLTLGPEIRPNLSGRTSKFGRLRSPATNLKYLTTNHLKPVAKTATWLQLSPIRSHSFRMPAE